MAVAASRHLESTKSIVRARPGTSLHLIVDSTGLSIVGEGEWAAAKHGGRGVCGLSWTQLATLVSAARKAVVYQWEARKRTPSPLFWQRIAALYR